MKTNLKNKKGFTLTELMIVVVILGILVLIAIPIYNNVTADARESACQSNMRTIESAIVQYAAVEGVDASTLTITATDGTVAGGPEGAPTTLVGSYINEWPTCPSGGTYTVTTTETW